MGRTTTPITDTEIRRAKPKDKMYKLFDGNGLFLEVKPNNTKVFRVSYRFNNKTKTYTLGNYPTITLSMARMEASEVRQKAKNGIDPVIERQELNIQENKPKIKVHTFIDVSKEFFEIKSHEYSLSHYQRQVKRLENYVYPSIGSSDITKITKQDIVSLIKNVPNVQTPSSKSTNKIHTAKRVFTIIKQIMNYAYYMDYIDNNVCNKVDVNSMLPKISSIPFKASTTIEAVQTYFQMFDEYAGDISTVNALKFLALTALRSGNIRNLKWEYVDFQNDVVNFPSEAMKNKTPFNLPLTPTLTYLIDMMKPFTRYKSEYVFCSPIAPTKPLSENTLNYAHKRMGITEHNAHGWRSAFSTICYEGYSEHHFGSEVIESQLAHSLGSKVKTAYLRSDFIVERHKLLLWWERQLTS